MLSNILDLTSTFDELQQTSSPAVEAIFSYISVGEDNQTATIFLKINFLQQKNQESTCRLLKLIARDALVSGPDVYRDQMMPNFGP